jgi:hypothetical protein
MLGRIAKRRPTRTRDWRQRAQPLWTALAVCAIGACSRSPTAPSTVQGVSGSDVVSLELSCQNTLIVGEQAPCIAVARLRSGRTPLVSPLATWSTAQPSVVAVDAIGTLTGRAAGQAVVTAIYQGHSAQAMVSVTFEDALRIKAAAEQGDFRPGTTVTMLLQGYYSVASADVGRLSLRISDQNGIVTQTVPSTMARGGDFFLLSSTFVVPQASTQVCRAAILEVGGVTISAPDPAGSTLACLPIRR